MLTGPCSPWATVAQLRATPAVAKALSNLANTYGDDAPSDTEIDVMFATAIDGATQILYQMTGQKFSGVCGPVIARPVYRPVKADSRPFVGGLIYGSFSGSGAFITGSAMPVVSSYGRSLLPVIELDDFPVVAISSVKIDGTVIPDDEYELRNGKHLVRLRTGAGDIPTARFGWPTSQVQDLPDTELGTFSVTYTFGLDPGAMGRMSTLALASSLVLPTLGDPTQVPETVTKITRQGIEFEIASPIDMISKGQTGIRVVDLWVKAVNPFNARRPSIAWSPDLSPMHRRG